MSAIVSGVIESHYVEVALPVPLRKLFTYDVPNQLRGALKPGSRVADGAGDINCVSGLRTTSQQRFAHRHFGGYLHRCYNLRCTCRVAAD